MPQELKQIEMQHITIVGSTDIFVWFLSPNTMMY